MAEQSRDHRLQASTGFDAWARQGQLTTSHRAWSSSSTRALLCCFVVRRRWRRKGLLRRALKAMSVPLASGCALRTVPLTTLSIQIASPLQAQATGPEQGTACGRCYRIGCLFITDPGDSEIIRSLDGAECERRRARLGTVPNRAVSPPPSVDAIVPPFRDWLGNLML